jgi:hypothetical protein
MGMADNDDALPGDGDGDTMPGPYEDSFSISPEGYDGSEWPTMFNGADASGSSW